MPTFVKGDMWSVFGKTDLFLITTNPIITRDGRVVMGRGIAKQAAERYPSMPYEFAVKLRNMERKTNVNLIGVFDRQPVGYFMVKDHWRSEADPAIIQESVKSLMEGMYFKGTPGGYNDSYRVDLNFPGIGNGKLRREDVAPLLEVLPDNVHIWEYGE